MSPRMTPLVTPKIMKSEFGAVTFPIDNIFLSLCVNFHGLFKKCTIIVNIRIYLLGYRTSAGSARIKTY